MSVVDDSFGHPMKVEEEASAPLAGGIMQNGYQCGMLWGASLAAGAQVYRLHGPGPQAETATIIVSQRLVESFRAHTKNEINCIEITELDMKGEMKVLPFLKYLVKGGKIGAGACFRLAANYASVAFNEINTTHSEKHVEAPAPPLSCAAVVAQKMGASDMHTVMAAGFAGGIGLSGGACGALGAAIWIKAMKSREDSTKKIDFSSPITAEVVDRFVECTDREFECSEIVGRKFVDVGDHADYLRNGGCSTIIEVLAAI